MKGEKSYRESFGLELPPAGTPVKIGHMSGSGFHIAWPGCTDGENLLYIGLKNKAAAVKIADQHKWPYSNDEPEAVRVKKARIKSQKIAMKKDVSKQIEALERAIQSPAINDTQRAEMQKQLDILRGQSDTKKSPGTRKPEEKPKKKNPEKSGAGPTKAVMDRFKAKGIKVKKSEVAQYKWTDLDKDSNMSQEINGIRYSIHAINNGEDYEVRKGDVVVATSAGTGYSIKDLQLLALMDSKKKKKVKKPKMTDQDCAEALQELETRRKKYKASGRKYRTKPVSQKIAGNISTAVNQALNNVPADKIKNDPAGMFRKMEKLEKSATEFFEDFKALLGEDYEKSEAKAELDKISERISEFRKKYAN